MEPSSRHQAIPHKGSTCDRSNRSVRNRRKMEETMLALGDRTADPGLDSLGDPRSPDVAAADR